MENTTTNSTLKVSKQAANLSGSAILKIAYAVKELIDKGEKIYNLTVGDFDPSQFPIPAELKQEIINAYNENQTNYPPSDGVSELKQSIVNYLKRRAKLDFDSDEIIVSGGARPIIYGAYASIVDPGDTVIYPVPSWNNNHYAYLFQAKSVVIEGKAENHFMPSADDIRPAMQDATLVAVCSPQNPAGTMFSRKGLEDICDLILEENKRRGEDRKPVYLLYDQIYYELTLKGNEHFTPISLRPEMKKYTIFTDGISKSLSATGVRVGWGYGPKEVISKMKAFISHFGAWAPKAEQVAVSRFLANEKAYDSYIEAQRERIYVRSKGLHDGFQQLKSEGFAVDSIEPQGALYLTVKFDLKGKTTSEGKVLAQTEDVTSYILNEAKLAAVPFYAFGTSTDSPWYRISIGTLAVEDIQTIIENLRRSLITLN